MSILKIRVLLDDSEMESYRDIEISEDDHLESLHYQIIQAFGLRGDQMASFYKSDEEWEKGEEIPLMNMEDEGLSMRDTILKKQAGSKGKRFFYIYNFLTLWIFYVEVMEVKKGKPKGEFPQTTKSYGPDIDEDARNEDSEMPGMEGVTSGKRKRAAVEEEYLDDYGLDDDDGDPLDGEFEDIDDYDF